MLFTHNNDNYYRKCHKTILPFMCFTIKRQFVIFLTNWLNLIQVNTGLSGNNISRHIRRVTARSARENERSVSRRWFWRENCGHSPVLIFLAHDTVRKGHISFRATVLLHIFRRALQHHRSCDEYIGMSLANDVLLYGRDSPEREKYKLV